jgi:adenylate cyclase
MNLFENYALGIEDILDDNSNSLPGSLQKKKKPSDFLLKGMQNNFEVANEHTEHGLLQGNKALLNIDRNGLQKLFGPNESSFDEITIGSHPDFKGLGYNDYLYHHCVSMFVDIKGSTRLALKQDLTKVRLIKDSLLTLCIHVANFFGGHIHRLQGDAVFVQFVRKGRHENDAVINSLNTASVLCQFVEKDLKEIFLKKGLSPIKIRVGIDYGNDSEVLWSHYGVPGCTELTTTSLHTDLAAKLQSKAKSNGIVIGDHVVKTLDLPNEYLDHVYKTIEGKQEIETYVINGFTYKQHEFQWKKYLLSFDFVHRSDDGSSLNIKESGFRLICSVADDGHENWTTYYQNSYALPKGKRLFFNISFNGRPYHRQTNEVIEWEVHNRGEEAKGELTPDIGSGAKNEVSCYLYAKYLGHHYLTCKVTRTFGPNIKLSFPIYVQ